MPNNAQYDFIILDELDCIAETITGDTMKENGLYTYRINKFLSLLENANQIIMAEAIPSLISSSFINDIREQKKGFGIYNR